MQELTLVTRPMGGILPTRQALQGGIQIGRKDSVGEEHDLRARSRFNILIIAPQ